MRLRDDAELQVLLARMHGPRMTHEARSGSGEGDNASWAEGTLLGRIRRLGLDNGFLVYHTHDSRLSEEGYPDCTLAKPRRLIFAELKDRRRKATHAQEVWLDVLRHSVPGVEVYFWRPSDWPQIVEILTRRTAVGKKL